MTLLLEQQYIDEMIAHAREDAPNECCGIIGGLDGRAQKLYRAINAEASPYRYSVEPKDLLRIHREVDGNDWDFLVIYHSHTHTEAYPSPTDAAQAPDPSWHYILVSLRAEPVLHSYQIVDGNISEEPVVVEDR